MMHRSQKPMTHLPYIKHGAQRSPLGAMLLCGAATLAIGASINLQAQTVYRIVGPDGKVSFSDRAPVNANSQATSAQTGAIVTPSNPALPYDLQQLVGKYPVTLYTSNGCTPCSAGRNLLMQRGVPFTERTINTAEDNTALQQLSGDTTLPFATIGRQQLKGFSDTEWVQYLEAAGYPSASKLPGGYRNPPPSPFVTAVKAPPKAENASSENAARPARAQRTPRAESPPNPAGIRF